MFKVMLLSMLNILQVDVRLSCLVCLWCLVSMRNKILIMHKKTYGLYVSD